MDETQARAIVARARSRTAPEPRSVARSRHRLGRPGRDTRRRARASTRVARWEATQAIEVVRLVASTLHVVDARAGRMPHPEKTT